MLCLNLMDKARVNVWRKLFRSSETSDAAMVLRSIILHGKGKEDNNTIDTWVVFCHIRKAIESYNLHEDNQNSLFLCPCYV